MHSFLDLVSASLSFFTVREAGKPADHDHPFGHGKIETLSSLFESLLLAVAAGLIFYEGIKHLYHPHPIHHGAIAAGVMLISMGINYWIYRHNLQAAQITDSSALHVNALHFLSDIVTSLAVLLGLLAIKLTGWNVIDPLLAFAVAIYILIISMKQVKRALLELSDTQLPDHEIQQIRNLLGVFHHKIIEAHDLRTRKSGATRHIDFHLVVCREMTVNASHGVCDEIESKIIDVFPSASVNIHVEPCEHGNPDCGVDCPVDKKKKKKKE